MEGRILTLCCLLLAFTHQSVAISDHRRLLRRDGAATASIAEVPSFYVDMPIDHFDEADTRTYYNRYYMNDTYYRAGGPVFFYDAGESNFTATTAASYLGEAYGPTAMMQLAQHYNGLVIGWEHRYYGESQPFPETIINDTSPVNGTADTWQYLTQEQALEDVVYFATNFAPDGYSEAESAALRPSRTPWIWIGGSYPGSRGAWMRIRNPEIIYAVWSSSAPVEARADGSPYFTPIASTLPANCSADINAVVKYIDQIMSGKYSSLELAQLQFLTYVASTTSTSEGFNVTLNMSAAVEYDESVIAQTFATPLWTNFQYDGPSKTTHAFCDLMQSYDPMVYEGVEGDDLETVLAILQNPGNMSFNDEGIVRHYGLNAGVQAYMYAARAHLSSLPQSDPGSMVDTYSWTYQYLTEFGWFQGSRPGHISIVSTYDNYTYERDWPTAQYFGIQSDIIPDEPDVNHTLSKYGGWEMSPTNVMFTNGEHDPWRTFSVMSQEQELGAPKRNIVQAVPKCNQPPQGTDVFGLLYPDAVHVPDFAAPAKAKDLANSPYNAGLTLFSQALDVWLPCFKAR